MGSYLNQGPCIQHIRVVLPAAEEVHILKDARDLHARGGVYIWEEGAVWGDYL